VKTLGEVRAATTSYFESVAIPSARLDAELLLAKVLGLERVQVYAQFERLLTEAELAAIRPLVKRRAGREPMAWILGTKGFYEHDFEVRPGTLVPRPDTETLVELALAVLVRGENQLARTLEFVFELFYDSLLASHGDVER
jgi:release factor glutamine methyltransferase